MVIDDVCTRNDYHLLECDLDPTHLRLLVSLQPKQSVSRAIKLLKGNLQYEFGKLSEKLLGRGYFARSSGTVDLERARNYVDRQVSHHGYSGEWTKPLKYRNPAFRSPAFSF